MYPYFIDIFDDLCSRSDNKAEGIDRVTFFEVSFSSLLGLNPSLVFQPAWHIRRKAVQYVRQGSKRLYRQERICEGVCEDILVHTRDHDEDCLRNVNSSGSQVIDMTSIMMGYCERKI